MLVVKKLKDAKMYYFFRIAKIYFNKTFQILAIAAFEGFYPDYKSFFG